LPRVRLLGVLIERGPMTSADLARELGLTPRAVTALVDGLEEGGLVRRTPHPSDRRAAVVEPTVAGRRVRRELDTRFVRFAGELSATVRAEDLGAAIRTLDALGATLDARG
jgi:DNA-binding MarR family transcriptional regulator